MIVDDNAALNSGQTIGSYEIISFISRGVHALKGVPEEWELFAVAE